MSIFIGKESVDINEMDVADIQFNINSLKNLSTAEGWNLNDTGFTDFSYLCDKVACKYSAILIVIEDKSSSPGKTIYSLGYRFATEQDKLAFILKFS
jgi:hypothetical protein